MAEDEDEVDASESFSPPIEPSQQVTTPITPKTLPAANNARGPKEPFDADDVRDAQLKRELEGVQNINKVIEGVIGSLERAKKNMGDVSHTVDSASTLLNTWTRMLSQTEHNQRLLLNPDWKGATQDLHDMEAEAQARQQAAERKAAEDERRRQEARTRAEERQRARMAGTSSDAAGRPSGMRGPSGGTTATARGRGGRRGILRGPTTTNNTWASGAATSSSRAASSQSGRGFGGRTTTRGTRGPGRGGS